MKLLPTIALLLLASCLFAEEDDPFSDNGASDLPPCHVRVQVRWIETTQTELSQITGNLQSGKESLHTSILKSIAARKAKIVHESMVVARSGEKATAESIREMVYPSEYDPPGIPPSPEEQKRFQELIANSLPGVRPFGSTPIAFETRNVGDTLEIEPTISEDRQSIDLRVAPERVMFKRWITYVTHKDEWGNADIFFPSSTPNGFRQPSR